MAWGTLFNLRNVLILLGVIITSVGVVYFASEFIDRLSEWGKVLSLLLLTVTFVALGRHFEIVPEGDELVTRAGWRWLRVTTALYLLGLLAALTAVIVFLSMERVDRIVKVFSVIVLGLALIVAAGRWRAGPEAA